MTVLKWGDHVVATGLIVGHTVPVTKGTRGVVVHAQGARVWVVPEDRHNASSYSAVLWERDRGAPLAADTTAGWQAYWDGVALERANTEPVRDRAPDREGRMNDDAAEMFAHAQYAAEDEYRYGLPGPEEEEPLPAFTHQARALIVELRAEVDRWRAEAEQAQEVIASWQQIAYERGVEIEQFEVRVSVLEAGLRERTP